MAETVILGAGIAGLSAAYYIRQSGQMGRMGVSLGRTELLEWEGGCSFKFIKNNG